MALSNNKDPEGGVLLCVQQERRTGYVRALTVSSIGGKVRKGKGRGKGVCVYAHTTPKRKKDDWWHALVGKSIYLERRCNS